MNTGLLNSLSCAIFMKFYIPTPYTHPPPHTPTHPPPHTQPPTHTHTIPLYIIIFMGTVCVCVTLVGTLPVLYIVYAYKMSPQGLSSHKEYPVKTCS